MVFNATFNNNWAILWRVLSYGSYVLICCIEKVYRMECIVISHALKELTTISFVNREAEFYKKKLCCIIMKNRKLYNPLSVEYDVHVKTASDQVSLIVFWVYFCFQIKYWRTLRNFDIEFTLWVWQVLRWTLTYIAVVQ